MKLLGRTPPRHDPRTFKLSRFVSPHYTSPPAQRWIPDNVKWGMMLNDQVGDCAIATPGHMIQSMTGLAGQGFIPSDADIMQAYRDVSGYRDTKATDNGCNVLDVLNYWRTTGIAGHKIYAFASVNPKNREEVDYAIYNFGGLFLGIDMPTAWGEAKVWDRVDGPTGIPGSWGGHAVPALAYRKGTDTTIVSWGEEYSLTERAFSLYVEEAWAVLSLDWLGVKKVAPNGFNFSALNAALNSL